MNIVTKMICWLALVLLVLPSSAQDKADPKAEKIMRDAHVARSGWDAKFPGFTAKLQVLVDGKVVEGTVKVKSKREVEVDLPKGEIADWAKDQINSIIFHRYANVRDDYEVAFADKDLTHPLGRLIKFINSSSVYRIKGDVITEVHRGFARGRFTISVSEVIRNPKGKYLPRHFNVTYWDKAGNLMSNEDYQEEWARLGKYDVPKRRLMIKTAKDSRTVRELRFSDHKPLARRTGN